MNLLRFGEVDARCVDTVNILELKVLLLIYGGRVYQELHSTVDEQNE